MPDHVYYGLLEDADGAEDRLIRIKLEISERFGLRIHEVFKMRHSIINETLRSKEVQKTLLVVGKGGLKRYIPLTEGDIDFLRRINGIKDSGTDRIFVREDQDTKSEISKLQTFISDHRLDKGYSHHGLRHRYAQRLYNQLRSTGLLDLEARRIVSVRLGHGRIDITYTYLDVR
jgi:integrase